MIEERVRELLRRRAGDVTPSPDAWERIAERISSRGPAPVVLEPGARRRGRNRVVVLGAIAAGVLVLIAGVAGSRDRGDRQTIRAAEDTSSSGDRVPGTTTTPPAPTTPPADVTFQATAEAAVHAWVRALAVGDGDEAWDLLAEESRKATGGRSGFDARLGELAEGWGSWDGAPDVTYRTVPLAPGAGEDAEIPASLPRLGVVIVSGRLAQEGPATSRTMSLPVRGTREKASVDPFADVGIELDPEPETPGRLAATSPLGAYTPAVAQVWFLLDDREPVGPDSSEGADGEQQHVTFTPVPPLSPGRHGLTVVALTVDGRVASRSATYTVA